MPKSASVPATIRNTTFVVRDKNRFRAPAVSTQSSPPGSALPLICFACDRARGYTIFVVHDKNRVQSEHLFTDGNGRAEKNRGVNRGGSSVTAPFVGLFFQPRCRRRRCRRGWKRKRDDVCGVVRRSASNAGRTVCLRSGDPEEVRTSRYGSSTNRRSRFLPLLQRVRRALLLNQRADFPAAHRLRDPISLLTRGVHIARRANDAFRACPTRTACAGLV